MGAFDGGGGSSILQEQREKVQVTAHGQGGVNSPTKKLKLGHFDVGRHVLGQGKGLMSAFPGQKGKIIAFPSPFSCAETQISRGAREMEDEEEHKRDFHLSVAECPVDSRKSRYRGDGDEESTMRDDTDIWQLWRINLKLTSACSDNQSKIYLH